MDMANTIKAVSVNFFGTSESRKMCEIYVQKGGYSLSLTYFSTVALFSSIRGDVHGVADALHGGDEVPLGVCLVRYEKKKITKNRFKMSRGLLALLALVVAIFEFHAGPPVQL
eukprot:m.150246 g.150246  ORF g.150246 m.150246 type:complete len:113 (+) comp16168_c1_seq2:1519-1857(+)